MAPHSSTLAWKIPGTGEPGGLLFMGSHRIGHNWSDLAAAAKTFLGFPGGASGKEPANAGGMIGAFDPWVRKIPWRRKWHPTPVFLPREFHRQRSLVGYSPQGCRVRHDWSDLAQHKEVIRFTQDYTFIFSTRITKPPLRTSNDPSASQHMT